MSGDEERAGDHTAVTVGLSFGAVTCSRSEALTAAAAEATALASTAGFGAADIESED